MSRACFAVVAAHYNDGRGIVFIGHSQGASILIALLKRVVDAKPAVRRRLVSALLLGENVTVPKGRAVGGDFEHIPASSRPAAGRRGERRGSRSAARVGPRRTEDSASCSRWGPPGVCTSST